LFLGKVGYKSLNPCTLYSKMNRFVHSMVSIHVRVGVANFVGGAIVSLGMSMKM
jgi:hypothetical protein